jgi:hypothetical protein
MTDRETSYRRTSAFGDCPNDDADHLLTRRADADYAATMISAWAERYLPASRAVRRQAWSDRRQRPAIQRLNVVEAENIAVSQAQIFGAVARVDIFDDAADIRRAAIFGIDCKAAFLLQGRQR